MKEPSLIQNEFGSPRLTFQRARTLGEIKKMELIGTETLEKKKKRDEKKKGGRGEKILPQVGRRYNCLASLKGRRRGAVQGEESPGRIRKGRGGEEKRRSDTGSRKRILHWSVCQDLKQ